jgi:hypothetical protein
MTPDSKELQQFIQSNLSHKLKHIKHQKFSKEGLTFLETIIKKIIAADKDFDYLDLHTGDFFEDFTPKGIHYKLCPEKVRNHIQSISSMGQSCRFSINGRKINIHLVYEYNKENRRPCFRSIFADIFHRIYLVLHLLTSYSRSECSESLTIYLYLTSMKKTLADCSRDCTIGEDNANTAFTFSCKRINEVYIYRKEEWFKVLCHELFHSFGLDFSEYDCTDVDKKVFTIFPIKVDLRLYEVYTELWGELLNILFIAYLRFPKESAEKILKKVEPFVYQERMFSVYQSSKVIAHFGMSYEDLYERTDQAMLARRNYKETTPVLSYYILKNIVMFHIHDFMDWCVKYNHSSLEFNKTNVMQNVDHFISFIREHYLNKNLIESMKQSRTWLLKQENNQRTDKTPIYTLRMSLLER